MIEPGWQAKAACHATIQNDAVMATAWIEEGTPFEKSARRICASCPVRRSCLQDALLDEEAEGMRDGHWFDSGRLPVADAREIKESGLQVGPWQSLGRLRS